MGDGAGDGRGGIDAARELADFLRGRRERLTPEMVGLRPRRPGRTPGLRREEVAQLASVSADYVTRLEQARGLRPSAEVINALSRALHLDDDETAYLYGLAGHAPPTRPTAQDTIGSLTALVTALSPLPAMLVDDHFDIRAWNPEMSALMLDFDSVPPGQRNTIWLCAMHPAMPAYYRDRARIMREGIADLRAAWASRPEDSALAELVQTLCRDSAEFARFWDQRDVKVTADGIKKLRHATAGPLDVHYNTLTPLGDRHWRLYVYRAADPASQQTLDTIVSGVTTQ